MINKVIILLFFGILLSCEKEKEGDGKIRFYISVNDFELKDRAGTSNEEIPSFTYDLAGGRVSFTNEVDTFLFDTKALSIEEYLFEIIAGTYNVEIETPTSLYGQVTPSFRSTTLEVSISELTDTLVVTAEPTCALIVVKDDLNQLANGAFIIERRTVEKDDFVAYPLKQDSISSLYYTYLLPDTLPDAPNAFLWLYEEEMGEEKGGLHTEIFEIGYKYLIKVLE